MIVAEQKALHPHQMGLFDEENWDRFMKRPNKYNTKNN